MKLVNQSTLTSKIELPTGTIQEVTTLSNESTTENMTTSFLKVKSADKTFVIPDEEIAYTISLTNNSEYEIEDITFQDTMSENATFVTESVTIDGTSHTDYNPATGFSVPNIDAGATTEIKYKATVVETPTGDNVSNTAKVTYSVNEITGLEENTNTLDIPITNNIITLTKTSNKSAVIVGQTLTYQIEIENSGNITNTELVFTDPLPEGVTFVDGSVKIDGVEQPTADPTAGFSISDLEPSAKVVVTFDVTIDE